MRRAPLQYRPAGAFHKIRIAVICGIMLASLGIPAQATAKMSLQQAVLRAVERDGEISGLRQTVASRSIDIQSARDEYYPSLSLSGDSSTTDSNGPGITLTVSQILFDWGMIRSNIEAASQVRVQAVSDLKMAVEDMTLQVSEYFLDVDIIDRKIARTESYITFASRLAAQAEDRARAGISDNAEVARARLEIVRANDRMTQLKANRQIALSQIAFLVDGQVDRVQSPPQLGFARHYSQSAKIKSAVRIAPDYISARAGVAEAVAGVDIAKASRLPAIKLQAQGRTDLNGGKTRTALGISSGVNLSSSGLGRRKIQSAQLNLDSAKTSLAATERELTNIATSALEQLQLLRTSEASKGQQLDEAKTVLDTYEQQFIGGQRELLDVLTTGRDLYDAQVDKIETYDQRNRTEYKAAHDLGVLGTLILASSGGE